MMPTASDGQRQSRQQSPPVSWRSPPVRLSWTQLPSSALGHGKAYAGSQGQGQRRGIPKQGSIVELKLGSRKSAQLSAGRNRNRIARVESGRQHSLHRTGQDRMCMQKSQCFGSKCIDCRGAALAAGISMQVRVRCRRPTLPCIANVAILAWRR